MTCDFVRESGIVAFASRLKRLADRLHADTTRIYNSLGIEFNAGWFLVGYALFRRSDVGVTDLAASLGLTHGAVSQIAKAMTRKGLVRTGVDSTDGRRRTLSLTTEGRRTIESLLPVWETVWACAAEILEVTGQDVLKALDSIEDQLDEQTMFDRVMNRWAEVNGRRRVASVSEKGVGS